MFDNSVYDKELPYGLDKKKCYGRNYDRVMGEYMKKVIDSI